jgi:hypothetical protein
MKPVSKNAPMASAPFVYDEQGRVSWDKMWEDFCILAKEGGPPHRADLLKSKGKASNPNSKEYKNVIDEVLRAYAMLTPYKAWDAHGWVAVKLFIPNMAKWFCDVIINENVECKREGRIIYLPINDDFTIEKEIKNVVTVLAKAYHYWYWHRSDINKFFIHAFGKDFGKF